MKVIKEFREFAIKGSVMDMGIGVIIGTAFGKIVDSFVTDIFTPPLAMLLGKVSFSNLYINLSGTTYSSLKDAQAAGAITINYGVFLDSILHFCIVAATAFLFIRQMNKLRKMPLSSVATKLCEQCFTNIPARAVKCPNCTSVIGPNETRTVKINYRAS
ncbi:large conductance mechanosensitive channel protein MscL [Bacillus sp. Marseille-P3661]|uniref:large conductance mechanosensitive channel protein MscL n=1 Tax=Bacillus sp. Marseille-P3661 TaxID=1936234 RepID=UPI000C8604D8|nr:large conductance mechanosensitive channel protein MscL [Bacillus sp. Marseille-P3661]